MSSIRDLAIECLRATNSGQEAGHPEVEGLSHPSTSGLGLRDSSNSQETAKKAALSRCPTPIGSGQRDTCEKSGTIGGTANGTVGPRLANARLRTWAAQVGELDARRPVGAITGIRWFEMVICSNWWLDHFGAKAALDGWNSGDVFGVRHDNPGAGGLIDRLRSSRSLIMDGGRARWRLWGVPMKFNCGAYLDLPAFWEA